MIKIAETDKLHNAEQRLYETTARLDTSDQANMRLKLKLEETRNKLESGKCGRFFKPPLDRVLGKYGRQSTQDRSISLNVCN